MGNLIIKAREGKKRTTYEYSFEIANVGGKRKRISKGGFLKKSEAKAAGLEALYQYENVGYVSKNSDASVADVFDAWLLSEKKDWKETTFIGHSKKVNQYIKPAIGNKRIKSIDNETLQHMVDELYDNGMSRNTLSVIIGILNKAFRWAVINKYVVQSPVIDVHIPKNDSPKVETVSNPHIVISRDWMNEILTRFPEQSPAHIPLLLGYKLGLRLGEIFGLIWEDINFEKKEVTVRRQVQWCQDQSKTQEQRLSNVRRGIDEKGYWYFALPKYRSVRTIDILDNEFLELLKREKARQEKDRVYYDEEYTKYYLAKDEQGRQYITTEATDTELHLINIRRDGTYINPRTTQNTSYVIRKKLGLEDFDFHSLRHTHATELVDAGAKPEFVQHRLGHKKIEITMNTYYHLTDETRRKQADEINLF